MFGHDGRQLRGRARLDDLLVWNAALRRQAFERADQSLGIGRAFLPLGRNHSRDVEQRIRKHVTGGRNFYFESERRDARAQRPGEDDCLLVRRGRRRLGIAAQLEQGVLESHSSYLLN